jgi:transcriptional regulator
LRSNPFATLIASNQNKQLIDHLPILFLEKENKLIGHMAKNNPLAIDLDLFNQVTVLFHGPHCYISPSFYAEPSLHVPSWNYAAVHVSGEIKKLADADNLKTLEFMLDFFEPTHTIKPEKIQSLIHYIVSFEITITSIEAKLKISQNRSVEDQNHLLKNLEIKESKNERAIAKLMRGIK